MAEYKNHHYVPQHILNNFKNDKKQFFYYNKNTPKKPIIHRNTSKVFCKNYLYSYETKDGKKNSEVEFNFFKQLDTDADPIIKLIINRVRRNQLPNLSVQQKNIWDEFFIKQSARSPERLHSLEINQNLDNIYAKSRARIFENLSPQLKNLIDNEEFKNRLQLEAKVKSLETKLNQSTRILSQRGLYFARIIGRKKSFIIGSQPLVRIDNRGSNQLDDPKTEFWYPISHDVAVSIGSYEEKEKLFILTPRHSKFIRQFNSQITNQSNEYAGRSKELLLSLKKNVSSS